MKNKLLGLIETTVIGILLTIFFIGSAFAVIAGTAYLIYYDTLLYARLPTELWWRLNIGLILLIGISLSGWLLLTLWARSRKARPYYLYSIPQTRQPVTYSERNYESALSQQPERDGLQVRKIASFFTRPRRVYDFRRAR